MEENTPKQEEVINEPSIQPEAPKTSNTQNEINEFGKTLGKGLLYAVLTILRYIFVLPWDLWKKAVTNMAEQKDKKHLNIEGIKGFWPFLTFLKRFTIDFLIDACSVLSWFIYPIVGIIEAIVQGEFLIFLFAIIGAYFMPITFAITKDILQLLLIPVRKFLSWGSRPAQYLEMDMNKKKEK